jgi:hypothetical protein
MRLKRPLSNFEVTESLFKTNEDCSSLKLSLIEKQNKHAKNTDLSNIACFITKLAVKKVKGDKTHFGLHKSRLSEYNKYQIEICVVILSQK